MLYNIEKAAGLINWEKQSIIYSVAYCVFSPRFLCISHGRSKTNSFWNGAWKLLSWFYNRLINQLWNTRTLGKLSVCDRGQRYSNSVPFYGITKMKFQVVAQMWKAIEDKNADRFYSALTIGMAQRPAIDLNQTHQNGHSFLTFSG